MNATTGAILDILDLGTGPDAGQQMPRGIALRSNGSGAPLTAYVLNTLENTVSVVDVSNPSSLDEGTEIPVGDDPVPDAVRRGRIAFSSGFASTSGTFSCESCHPDGNTDQLLWRSAGLSSSGPATRRTSRANTMPVSGLKNTIPAPLGRTSATPFAPERCDGDSGTPPCPYPSFDAPLLHQAVASPRLGMVPLGRDLLQSGSSLRAGTSSRPRSATNMATFLASVSYRRRVRADRRHDLDGGNGAAPAAPHSSPPGRVRG